MSCRCLFVFSLALLNAGTLWALDATETAYIGLTGARYAICADTDLQGNSVQVVTNITAVTACAARCDTDGHCVQAVYDTQTRDCHIKAKGGLKWVANGRFDVIRLKNPLKEGTVISKCPFTTSSYASPGGTRYGICADTDYRGGSSQQINGVATRTACAQRCGSINGCTK